MKTKSTLAIVLLIAAAFVSPSSALAERAWAGSIHFVDVNMKFYFDGYEYGHWSDFGYLNFPGPGSYTIRSGKTNVLVPFEFLADQDNPLRSTIKGRIRLEVDNRKAELDQLVLVRKSRYADWRIDPEIIKKLEQEEKAQRDASGKAKAKAKALSAPSPPSGGASLKQD